MIEIVSFKFTIENKAKDNKENLLFKYSKVPWKTQTWINKKTIKQI